MFLKKLYHHSKILFFALVLFLMVFTFVNLKWGAVATPAYQYGMFSGPMHRADTQMIYQLFVNDRLLNIQNVSFAERDILFVALQQYEVEKERNRAVYATMKRLLSKAGIGNAMKAATYNNSITDTAFTAWYKARVERITGEKVSRLAVFSTLYTWNGRLQPISSPLKEGYIVAD